MFIYHFNRMIRSRVLWLVFAIIVGASFLALPSCFTGGMGGGEYAGTLGREKITQDEYSRAQIFVDRVMRASDQPPAAVETQIWAHIAAMRTAKELGIVVTAEELRSILLSQEAFQNGGAFDPDLYSRIVEQQLGLTAPGYERLLADQIVMSKLMSAVAAGYNASPMEIDDEVAARTDKVTFQYASISNAFLTAEIEATDDDILAYYEENKADYALPDRVAVRYATLSVTNFVPFVEVDDADIEDYYDANPSLYSRTTTNGVETVPLDDVRDSIRQELALQDAADIAVTNLNAFIESLATNDLETFTWRCEARHMKTADTKLFALEGSYIPGIEPDALKEFRETAHDLDASRDDSRYGVAVGRNHVYLLRATTNDYARTQSLDEVKDAIRPLAVASMRHKKFIASAEEVAAKLKAALAADPAPAFGDAASSLGLEASTSMVFSADSISPSAFENARAIAPAVARLKVGAVSEPIEVYGGAVLACVSAREAADPVAADSVRDQARSMMSAAYGSAAFQDWLVWNLNNKGFKSSRAAIYTAPAATDDEE